MTQSIAVLTFQCIIPLCTTLKQKRSIVRPILARLHHEFNISVAEVDHLDRHSSAIISCACISNDPDHSRQVLQKAFSFVHDHFSSIEIIEESLELI
jgi:uncharacterized protein YlxP (DUF503 family)